MQIAITEGNTIIVKGVFEHLWLSFSTISLHDAPIVKQSAAARTCTGYRSRYASFNTVWGIEVLAKHAMTILMPLGFRYARCQIQNEIVVFGVLVQTYQ